jgi:uncharacterized flavoprotein (TIGR03862 family)
MAAEALAQGGAAVDVYERMPSVGRKFLMAGKGGLNITHTENPQAFAFRYGERRSNLGPLLAEFGPDALRAWVHGLGIETFIGTSGRVFPAEMKAAPLLRAWLHRLRSAGVRIHVRHRWSGWDDNGALVFETPSGSQRVHRDALVLALGGASWPQLGSDGAWTSPLGAHRVAIAPLRPANCGFDVDWSAHFRTRFSGEPVKSVVATVIDSRGGTHTRPGELVVTEYGVEGSLVYALSAPLRDTIEAQGCASFTLDLAPAMPHAKLAAALAHPRGSRSTASHIQSRTGMKGVKTGLLRETLSRKDFDDPQRLAAAIKALPLTLVRPRPLAEAISTAGGVRFEALDENLMLNALPGVFCAGEMLDWEAPTGGYLLTACFASGRAAGRGALRWLEQRAGRYSRASSTLTTK